jgi:hypothetical protein
LAGDSFTGSTGNFRFNWSRPMADPGRPVAGKLAEKAPTDT